MGLSRQTLVTLWLGLTLLVAIRGWSATHPDDCARYARGDRTLSATQEVDSGKTVVTVPCDVWFPRQTPVMQGLVALDGIIGLVFCFSFWADARRAAERRRALRAQ